MEHNVIAILITFYVHTISACCSFLYIELGCDQAQKVLIFFHISIITGQIVKTDGARKS